MAENAEIQKVGERVFERVLKWFGWIPQGKWNTTSPCSCSNEHGCRTHPTDIVAYYDDRRIGNSATRRRVRGPLLHLQLGQHSLPMLGG
jgi:hypothetical protein